MNTKGFSMQNITNSIGHNNIYSLNSIKKQNLMFQSDSIQNNTLQNVSFRGTETLAAYNYSLVNKNELFNLPIIKPLDIPTKIEDIKGEKIYNSDGELVRMISNDSSKQTTYYFRNNELHYTVTKDNNSDIKWTMWFDGNDMDVTKILPDGTEYSTYYEKGVPVQISKYKMSSNNNEIEIDYLPKEKTYSVRKQYTENGKQYSSFAEYDSNKKCIYASETEGMHNETTDLHFINGIPYDVSTTKSDAISTEAGKDDINLTNLEPAPFYEINMDKINSIDGDRKYYSNGQMEKLISKEGDIYTFEPEGILKTIESKNKKIEFDYEYKDNKIHGHKITEKMSNGGIKKTQYNDRSNDGFVVWYENKDIEKHVMYNDKGNIVSYTNKQNGQKEISRDYDDEGNLIRCWDK